ncbi:MAG: riboflavin biosynthesis protein RibF [Oscillospiraceae bacterium]
MRSMAEFIKNKCPSDECAVALGYFDGIHVGHAAVLRCAIEAAKSIDAASYALTFDMSALRASGKGGKDLLPRDESQRIAQNMGIDSFLTLNFGTIAHMSGEEFVCEVLMKLLKARVICCGSDFRFGKNRSCGVAELRAICGSQKIETIVAEPVFVGEEIVSTSKIKAMIGCGDVEKAALMLGRAYGMALRVTHGKRLARNLGFPTINQVLPSTIVEPRHGVYRSKCTVGKKVYFGVTNVGLRPTVECSEVVTLETHLLDFCGDLYGDIVHTSLDGFMRDEQKFSGVDELRAAVLRDIDTVRHGA